MTGRGGRGGSGGGGRRRCWRCGEVHRVVGRGRYELDPAAARLELDGRTGKVDVLRGLRAVGARPLTSDDLPVREHPRLSLPDGLVRASLGARDTAAHELHDHVGGRDLLPERGCVGRKPVRTFPGVGRTVERVRDAITLLEPDVDLRDRIAVERGAGIAV